MIRIHDTHTYTHTLYSWCVLFCIYICRFECITRITLLDYEHGVKNFVTINTGKFHPCTVLLLILYRYLVYIIIYNRFYDAVRRYLTLRGIKFKRHVNIIHIIYIILYSRYTLCVLHIYTYRVFVYNKTYFSITACLPPLYCDYCNNIIIAAFKR